MIALRNVHSALQAFANKNHIALDPLFSVGYLTLMINNTHRIHLVPLQSGGLVFIGRICPLPEEGTPEQEKMIDKVLNLAYANARTTEAYPALEPDQKALTLQMMVLPHIDLWEFEEKLDYFAHQFGVWRNYLLGKNKKK